MYRIHQIKLDTEESIDLLPKKIARKVHQKGFSPADISSWRIVRESLDARKKDEVKLVYTVDFETAKKLRLDKAPDMSYNAVSLKKPLPATWSRPVVVGFGPCGMFAALILSEAGLKPIVIERGSDVESRIEKVKKFWEEGILDKESNVQFGEGGAGTFSDGKLTTGIKDPRIRKVLETFVDCGAPEDILYKQKPHIGTDVLRTVVKNLRNHLIELGADVYFNHKMIGMETENNQVTTVIVREKESGRELSFETENLILALGHSARDTFRYLSRFGIPMEQKPFSIGVRIEHPQETIDAAQYGPKTAARKILPPADYKLSYRCENGRGVYTFCMCPGGEVIVASSQAGGVVTNGMSNRKRDSGVANAALLVDVRTSDFDNDDPLAGVAFQEKYEKLAYEQGGSCFKSPAASWADFRDNKDEAQPVIRSLPAFATEAIREAMPHLGRKLKGFDGDQSLMKAVETRSSSPVRFPRDESFQSSVKGLYPGGEGTGHAGGIVSAACDGIKIAESIILNF